MTILNMVVVILHCGGQIELIALFRVNMISNGMKK